MNITYEIVNIVTKATLENKVNLNSLLRRFPKDVKYGSDYYGGRFAHFKSKLMQGRVAIWPSGKMMGLGTKTQDRAISELKTIAKELGSGFKVQPTIANIVILANAGSQIDLERCVTVQSQPRMRAIYEPEQFPGVLARLKLPCGQREIAVLFFSSGKLIIPGLKSTEEINVAIKTVSNVLKECVSSSK